jgi:hypothetical protein
MKICIVAILCSLPMVNYAQLINDLKTQPTIKVNGGITATTSFYNANGITARRAPFSYALQGNINIALKGYSLPFSFMLSEQNRSFRQPFNQFGIRPTFKWGKVHVGYSNVSFAKYALDGHVFLGAAVEANIKKLRLGALYGRFLRAVKEDSTLTPATSVSQYPYAAFNRYGYGAKIGFGGKTNNFIDLVIFKAKDDSNSNKAPIVKQQIQPAENVVLGIKSNWTFAKKMFVDIDMAASALTRNIRTDTLAIEQQWQKISKALIKPRYSTQLYLAGEAALGIKEKNWGVKGKYVRVDADYQSMGIYFLQTDMEQITIESNAVLQNGKLTINGSYGIQHDNLAKKKLAQTNRKIGSLAINYNPKTIWGVSFQFTNFGTTQQPGLKSIDDTVILDQVTNSIILIPRYTIIKKNAIHNIIPTLSRQSLNDRNKINSTNFEMEVLNATLNYAVSWLKANFTNDATLFYTKSNTAAGESVNIGAGLGVGKTFLKNKLDCNVNGTYSTNSFNGTNDGSTTQVRLSSRYKHSRHHAFNASVDWMNNVSNVNIISKSFTEVRGVLAYTYSF